MPSEITAVAYDPPVTPTTGTAEGTDGWAHWASNTTITTIAIALVAALLAGLTVWALMRRPQKADLSKHLMYVPLLLVNAAAIYGQVAFFYDSVAPDLWPIPGKLALGIVIALAVESIAVYVGWHAHDALLNKAGATAARLRRASYLIALVVAGINYAHFAEKQPGNPLGLNAAAVAFGLLSLLSPWLWGLHTRRMQHVQLRKDGIIDAAGATFSAERIRLYPVRAFMARRWSVDNYVTDPQQAWVGYTAELKAQWAVNVERPGWWLRLNPVARVRQLTEVHQKTRTDMEALRAEVDEVTDRLTDMVEKATALRADLTATEAALEATRLELEGVTADRDTHLRTIERLTAEATSAAAAHTSATDALRASIADLKEALRVEREGRASDNQTLRREHAEALRKARLEAQLPNIADRRGKTGGVKNSTPSKPTGRPRLSDEDAVQRLLEAPADPARGVPSGDVREWSQQAIVNELSVGWPRAPRLLEAVGEAQRQRRAEGSTRGDAGDDKERAS